MARASDCARELSFSSTTTAAPRLPWPSRSRAGGRRRHGQRARAPPACPRPAARRRWWPRSARPRGRPRRTGPPCRRGRRRPRPRVPPARRPRPPRRAARAPSGGRGAGARARAGAPAQPVIASFRTREPWLPPKTSTVFSGTRGLRLKSGEAAAHGIAGEHALVPVERARVLPGAGGRIHERPQDAVREAGLRVGLEDHRAHSEESRHERDGTARVAPHAENGGRAQAQDESRGRGRARRAGPGGRGASVPGPPR